MKIIKVISSKCNIRESINASMDSKKDHGIANLLDACGCTGNGMC